MGWIAESDEFLKNHPKFKYFFYIVGILIIVLLCLAVRNAYKGKPVSIGSGGITIGDTTSNKPVGFTRDTVKAITNMGNNSGIIGDNNSIIKKTIKKEGVESKNLGGTQIIHSVSGSNNNVGVNGDVNVNEPPVLDSEYLVWVFKTFKRIATGEDSNNVIINMGEGSNGSYIQKQIVDYFKANNVKIVGTGMVLGVVDGIKFQDAPPMKAVIVKIGTFN